MPLVPEIACFLSDARHRALPGTVLWGRSLPMDRHGAADANVRYGDYFQAVCDFLQKDDCRHLVRGVSCLLKRRVRPGEIGPVAIFLEKHGAFYHPSRIRVQFGDKPLSMVVNAAVSDQGRAVIENEYRALRYLAREKGVSSIPEVYAMDRIDLGHGRDLPMFLGQWFDGYNEFHWSGDPAAGGRIRVWDPDPTPLFLAPAQTRKLYREAARILTSLYDPESCRQVAGWHHAAGDFVVRLDMAGQPELRLITVRNYAPLMDADPDDPRAVVEGLVLFLLGLALHMRLDRLDGVGEVCWAGSDILAPTLEGFFQALSAREKTGGLPPGFADGFLQYLVDYPESALSQLTAGLADGLPGADRTLARGNLTNHVSGLRFCLADLLANGYQR